MRLENIVILSVFASFAVLEMAKVGFFRKTGSVAGDGWVETISTLLLLLLVQPVIILSVFTLGDTFFADYKGALAHYPIVLQVALLLVFDDMMQYWWHRLTHRVPLLYKLHRPHHNTAYMSVRLVYRNSFLYYAFMPSIWLSAIMIYLGFGWVYAFYIAVKLTVITAAHCSVAWDEPLYKTALGNRIMWWVERIISTPSTHSMHHGKHLNDGVSHYKGNYGNLLFFWDVLFGTAKITRRRPTTFGVENLPDTTPLEQLFWPLFSTGKAAKAEKNCEL